MKSKYSLLVGLIMIAGVSRIIPHVSNFTAMGAMAVFGGAHFTRKTWAVLVPLVSLWVSDMFLNNVVYKAYFPKFTLFSDSFLWVGGSFALIAILANTFLKEITNKNIVFGSICASMLFFLISNFGTWYGGSMYPQNSSGLALCYSAGLPFFWNTVLGDLFYSGVLFGLYELAKTKWLTPQKV